jgi:putative Mg2+ transporter-C (MgtC) family protein
MDVSTSEELEILVRLVVAGTLGALIGLERELRGYPAGIRTTALVASGAALFTDFSTLFGDAGSSRVASNVVVGIGFIGAGVILRDRGHIHGITTAATIWIAAAIGMAIGLSLYIVGIAGALIVIAALEARPVTRRLDRILYGWLGELQESDDNEDLGIAWRRTHREWHEEEARSRGE